MRKLNRSSLFVHAALAGALALSASPLMADKLGNFEIQVVEQKPQAPQTGTAVQSPRDAASGQANGVVQNSATPAPDHEIEYDLVRKRADHEGEIDCVTNCGATSGQSTGRRQHEPLQIMAGPGDGAGTPLGAQGSGNTTNPPPAGVMISLEKASVERTSNPNQQGAAGVSASGRAMTGTANAIEVTNTDAGPPKPSTPTIGEPGTVKKNPSRRRPRTRKPGS
jgi:hypothetical protein